MSKYSMKNETQCSAVGMALWLELFPFTLLVQEDASENLILVPSLIMRSNNPWKHLMDLTLQLSFCLNTMIGNNSLNNT